MAMLLSFEVTAFFTFASHYSFENMHVHSLETHEGSCIDALRLKMDESDDILEKHFTFTIKISAFD